MIRWKYVVPRLVLLVVVLVVGWLAMNPLLRWGLIQAGQAATGAKVEIHQLKTLLDRSEVRLADVRFADPSSGMQNLFQAETSVLDIENSALLRKQFVIKEGRISGIQLGGARESDGRIEKKNTDEERTGPGFGQKATEAGEKWLKNASGKLEQQLENDLQSVRVARELMERWPAEYNRLEQKAKDIQTRGEALARKVDQVKDNPLAAVQSIQQTTTDINQLWQQTVAAKKELARVRQQIRIDRQTIQRAKRHDEKYVRDKFVIDSLDPETLTQYLLGDEMGGRVSGLIGWVQWARQMMPESNEQKATPAQRGIDIFLPGLKKRPTLLARKLVLDGSGSSGSEPFTFSGELTNLTTQPRVHGQPAVLNVQTEGAVKMSLNAELDHTGKDPIDRVVIKCPQLLQPMRTLGDAEKLAVDVSPGNSALLVDLTMIRNELSGHISVKQPNIELSPTVGSDLGGNLVANRMQTALGHVKELDARIELGGTLLKPRMKLKSNLGPALATGMNAAFRQELAARQEQLLAKAHQEVDQKVGKFEQQLMQKQREVMQKLQVGDNQIAELKRLLASHVGLPGNLNDGKNALLNGIMRKAGLR